MSEELKEYLLEFIHDRIKLNEFGLRYSRSANMRMKYTGRIEGYKEVVKKLYEWKS